MAQDLQSIPFNPALYFSSRESAPIEMLVLHYTDTPTLEECVSIFQDPDREVSCHYVVGDDGAILQMVRDKDCAWHCGASAWRGRERCNQWSLGIEIVNSGRLEKRDGVFYRWPDNYTAAYDGPPPRFIDGSWWAPYPELQMEKVADLSEKLVEQYRIPLDNVVRHSDIAPGRKIDPGPAFPWLEFKNQLNKLTGGRW